MPTNITRRAALFSLGAFAAAGLSGCNTTPTAAVQPGAAAPAGLRIGAVNVDTAPLVAYVGNRIMMELRQRLFAHLQRLPVAYFDRTRSGDLTSHLSNDVGLLQETLTNDLIQLGGNVVMLIGGITMAVPADRPQLGVGFAEDAPQAIGQIG